MNIAEIIQRNLDDMTRSERQVAVYYLGHAEEFAFATLEDAAKSVDTSTTSVLRFCRRLGFEGFKAFQQTLRQQLRFQPELPDKYRRTMEFGSDDGLLTRTVGQDIRCIHETFQELPSSALHRAVALLSGARRVFTVGMKESYALAHYAYSRLLTVRPEVQLLSGCGNGEIETLLSLTPEDVGIVFLFHRYTRHTLQILELIKSRNVPVILVTNEPCAQVEALAEILLPCRVDHGGIKNTAVAPIVLSDYLCDAVAAAMGEASLRHMQRSESLFRTSSVLGG